MQKFQFLLYVSFFPIFIFGQSSQKEAGRTCGMGTHMEQLQSDPVYAKLHKEKIKRFKEYTKKQGNTRQVCSNPVQIPVAIHFQDLNNPDEACLIALAQTQMEILNNDMQGLNADISNWNNNASNSFPGVSNGEACLELCIANQNHPSGYGLNDGDLAVTFNQTSGSFDGNWSGYINFFVREIDAGLLGFSPYGGNGNGDGITMAHYAFGSGSGCAGVVPGAPYDLGRTVTHELGHYLLLKHIWGGSNCGNHCGSDDEVSDTPNSQDCYAGCPAIGVSTCSSTDMHMNYMDYVNDACMYMFSDGQAVRMENYVSSNLSNVTSNASNVCGSGIFPVNAFLIDWKDPSCVGFDDGYIIVEATGGDGNFTYTLNGGSSNSNGEFLNLPAGNYTIDVEDGNGTMASPIDIQLIDPSAIEVIITNAEDVSCYGYENGTIEVDVIGGAGSIVYSIDGVNFSSSSLFTNLGSDSYIITVLDDNGCEGESIQVSILEPDPFLINLDSLLAPECGTNNGLIIAEGEGGLPLMGEYTYLLDSLTYDTIMIGGVLVDTIYHDTIAIISTDTLGVFENLYSGTYNISAIDENGCATVLDSVVLNEGEAIQINILDSNLDLLCSEDTDGFVEIDASGTIGPYTYSSDGINFTSQGLYNNLSPDSYIFYVMDGADCVNSIQVEVSSPDPLELNIVETNALVCNGATDGQITLSAAGGAGDYTFYQDNLANPIPDVLNNLGSGNLNIIVQDENMCTFEANYFVSEPAAINITIDNIVEVECFGDETGEVQVSADGGNGALSFTIGTETNASGFFNGLTSGAYTVIVTDENECTSEEIIEIAQTSDLQLDIVIMEEVSCNGDTNGAFSLNGAGGTGDYMYSLDGVNFTSQEVYTGFSGGLYDVFVADGNDCITIGTVELVEPDVIELDLVQLEFLDCYGDTDAIIRLNGLGGSGNYTFSNGLSSNSTGLFENQGGGSFTFSVVDENDCSETVSYTIEEPDEIIFFITEEIDNTCEGKTVGSITAAANGGTGILIYSIPGQGLNDSGVFENLGADDYNVIVTDINGCSQSEIVSIENTIFIDLSLDAKTDPSCFGGNNGTIEVSVSGGGGGEVFSIGSMSNSNGIFTGLAADTYEVEVLDAAGCIGTVTVEIEQPDLVELTNIEVTQVSCFGDADGSVELSATGGTGVISYTVNGETNTTGVFTDLPKGVYTYLIEDEKGCSISLQDNEFTITEPSEISIMISVLAPIECFGDLSGSIEFSATGGNGGYSYTIPGVGNSDGVFEQMGAGEYIVITTDQNGCMKENPFEWEQPEPLETSIVQQLDVACNGESTGSISLNTTGGTPAYTYTMEGISSSVSGYINLAAGPYTTFISDDNGCVDEFSFVINEPSAFNINATSTVDDGGQNGTIQLNISGGMTPYTILSSGGANFDANNFAQNLISGIYTIEIQDALGCRQTIQVEVIFSDKLDNILDGTTIEHVLYPIPSNTDLNLRLLSPNDQELYFYILDKTGKFLYEREDFAIRGENMYMFTLTDYASGNYILGLVSERQSLHFKFQVVD